MIFEYFSDMVSTQSNITPGKIIACRSFYSICKIIANNSKKHFAGKTLILYSSLYEQV